MLRRTEPWPGPRPLPPPSPTTAKLLLRRAAAAGVGMLAFVAVNLYACLVYRGWRDDLASRIDDPAERSRLAASNRIIAHGNDDTRLAVLLIACSLAAMMFLTALWALSARHNYRAWRQTSRIDGAHTLEQWAEETARVRRARIGPLPLVCVVLIVFAFTLFLRVTGPMGESFWETTLRQTEMEIDYVEHRMVLALVQVSCVLAAGFAVVWTTCRQLTLLRDPPTPG